MLVYEWEPTLVMDYGKHSRFWGSRWFTSLNLASAYWQVRFRKQDIEKMAFLTRTG